MKNVVSLSLDLVLVVSDEELEKLKDKQFVVDNCFSGRSRAVERAFVVDVEKIDEGISPSSLIEGRGRVLAASWEDKPIDAKSDDEVFLP